jgi:hypothetical protein
MPFEALLDDVCDEAEDAFEWSGYLEDAEARRGMLRNDLDALLDILGWAGAATRTGAELVPDRWRPGRMEPRGGLVGLTPVGRWWLGAP